jgi:hypothetical protein
MRLARILTLVAALLFPAALAAQPVYLFGRIGKSEVMAALDRRGDALTGWYLYFGVDKTLRLAGRIDPGGGFQLDETVDGRKTGALAGTMDGGRWSGEWRNPAGGAPLAVTLAESRDTLAGSSDSVRCAAKRRDKDGWTYEHSLTLALANGSVRTLDAASTATSAEDGRQGCFYALGDFRRVPSHVGVLLSATDEDDPLTADSQRCTIRIVGDADHLFVQFGDPSEPNDDCRFSGSTAFCSPRSWMADFVVDRRTKSCKPVGD